MKEEASAEVDSAAQPTGSSPDYKTNGGDPNVVGDGSNDNGNNNSSMQPTTTTTTKSLVESKVYDGIDTSVTALPNVPSVSATAVLGESATMPDDAVRCRGHDFNITAADNIAATEDEKEQQPKDENGSNNDNNANSIDDIMKSFLTTGFQATNVGLAVERIREMRRWRLSDAGPWSADSGEDIALRSDAVRRRIRCRIFLAYTSNQISCGQREVIRFLAQHNMVDVIVTSAGGIEEDIIKCFQPTYMGDFKLRGRDLRKRGINRIGNLLVPNKNYCDFEDWVSPIITQMHDEQDAAALEWAKQRVASASSASKNDCSETDPIRFAWTPSKVIHRLGKEINHPESVLYWAAKHNIPVFCPALTDGSFGDMLFFHSYKRPGFVLDIAQDVRRINDLAVRSHCTGQIILGGGLVKHHTCNANLMRNGANYSVYINTGMEFDGSDSGASPDEAVSWGKIRIDADPVKITSDASIVFPLIVSQTFAKDVDQWKKETSDCVCWVDDLNDVPAREN